VSKRFTTKSAKEQTLRSHFVCFALSVVSLFLLFSFPAFAGSYVGAGSGADLFEAPAASSRVVAHLPRLAAIEVLGRERNWLQVKSGQFTGWLPEGMVREGGVSSAPAAKSTSLFGKVMGAIRPNAPTDKRTAVLGVRGLEEGPAASTAAPEDLAGVQWMEERSAAPAEVQQFVADGTLNP